jgi:hypothetical protein
LKALVEVARNINLPAPDVAEDEDMNDQIKRGSVIQRGLNPLLGIFPSVAK